MASKDYQNTVDYFSKTAFWNYRVVKRVIMCDVGKKKRVRETYYFIAEVYYNENNEIISYVLDDSNIEKLSGIKAMAPSGIDSLDDLRGCLNLMKRALNKPVLDYDKLERDIENRSKKALRKITKAV